MDRSLENLLDTLGPEPSRGRIVVLTSDHGEEFFEHGSFEHGHAFYQEVLAVPLAISGLHASGAETEDRVVSLLDVAPTILARAKVPVPEEMRGQDLTTPVSERVILSTNLLYPKAPGDHAFSVRKGSLKLISHDGYKLFDVVQDPYERRDLAKSRPEVVEELAKVSPQAIEPGAPVTLDSVGREAIRALGYVD